MSKEQGEDSFHLKILNCYKKVYTYKCYMFFKGPFLNSFVI